VMDSSAVSYADRVRCERASSHVLLIRFDRAEKKNALHSSMVIELARLLDSVAGDQEIRAVVITGTENCFAAGADLNEMLEHGPANVVNNPARVDAWRRFERFPKPIIAAVNGVAFGAGCEMALACDFIIAGKNARFAQPEVKVGGMAGDGGTQRLPRKAGSAMACYMLLTGEPIDAETAFRVGLVVEVCDPSHTLDHALGIAKLISKRAPLAVQFTKACIKVATGATLENGLAFERESLWRNSMTSDRQEGLKAFTEKREPKFSGR
jgi:enoyl-CoA hydratase